MDLDDDPTPGLTGKSGTGYAWEEDYKRSWDVIQEDESGSLTSTVASIHNQKKRRRQVRDTSNIQRGIIRHVFLVLDLSRSATETDLRPNRLDLQLTFAEQFVSEYFDQNPLSQLGIIATRNQGSERVSDLSGNPADHVQALKKKELKEAGGEPSLQNSLELARTSLGNVPSHGSKEILVIWASLTTCDPGDIFQTLISLKKDSIRVSIVGLAAEMKVCKEIAKETRGNYRVVVNETHLRDILFENIPPPAVLTTKSVHSLVQMGFPSSVVYSAPTLCVCHPDRLTRRGYKCPRCKSLVCEIPTDCPVCGLTLVSSPLLARSYHHLFPVENYREITWTGAMSGLTSVCFSCLQKFADPVRPGSAANSSAGMNTGRYQCLKCHEVFCVDCELYIHDVLHNCPGCLSGKK